MPNHAPALVAAAGEHFVAYRLSALGFPVALTRGGSPTVDLMVGDLCGNAAISLQVKTSTGAWREYKRKPENNHWEWFVGSKVAKLTGKNIFYAFVDLKRGQGAPDVFVVPSHIVAKAFEGTNWKMNMYWLMVNQRDAYFDAWKSVTDRLSV
jgi:hypothetical protein